jgi:hypothetical protein
MLMKRDRLILTHIEHFGFITIQQCADLFFNTAKDRYTNARKRLKLLSTMEGANIDDNKNDMLIKKFINPATNNVVYSFDGRKISEHSILIMNFYVSMKSNDVNILDFQLEKKWCSGKVISDGFFKYKYNGKTKILLLEVDYTHDTDFKKYIKLYNSKEIQDLYKCFPPVVVATAYDYKKISKDITSVIKVKMIDLKYNDFKEKILDN